MKLWILRPAAGLPQDDDPWSPWYDKAFGFVVRAETEAEARALANSDAGDENRDESLCAKSADTTQPWIDPNYSTCVELTSEGAAEVVMRDFASS